MLSLTAQPAAKSLAARKTALATPAAATPAGPPGCLRPFVNERLNSRLSAALPAGSWSQAWTAPIDPNLQPTTVLATGDAALVLGRLACQLFVSGKPGPRIQTAGEDAELRPADGLFVVADRYSRLASFSLATSAPATYFTASGGNDTRRTFLHRRGANTIVASADESKSPHSQIPNLTAYLEVFDANGENSAFRDASTGRLSVAMHNDFIVVARPGAIDFLDYSLNAQRRIEADFVPRALSLDESGRAYVLCEVAHRQQLWIVAPSGDFAAVELPTGVTAFHRPPIVGYGHRCYLLCLNKILTINAAAELDWHYDAPARVAGATVTATGQLLAAIGDAVIALNPAGEPLPIARTPGEEMMASPILGSNSELYALTSKQLHCFRAA